MKEKLVNRILESARRRAASKNYRFDSRTEKELRSFINGGINNLSYSQLSSESTIRDAQTNITVLVDIMIENAQSRQISKSLDTSALNVALKGFCPRFPFC